jgi:IS30 family transposase
MPKVGRPAWVPTPETLEKIEEYAASGLTKDQIADCLGVCYMTINRQEKENWEFSDAFKKGKARGIALVTKELLKNIKKKNVTAQIFYLKCQAKWNDQSVDALENTIKNEIAQIRDMVQEWKSEKN